MRPIRILGLCVSSVLLPLLDPSRSWATAPFSIAVLPDTQYYCQDNVANPTNSLFHDQVNWLVENRNAQNLKFVTHLGDVVNVAGASGAASGQWAVAEDAMSRLRNSTLPFNILPGNHDWTSTAGTGSVEHYRTRFGDQANYFAGKSWFLGYDQRGVNTAVKFETPIGPMLNISLEFNATSPTAISGAPASPIAWAQSVINANKGIPTIISTHNSINPGSGRDGFGQSLFKQLVRDNNQVFMVLNGHYTGNDNEQDITSVNTYGRVVIERGVDYQNNLNGGDGWMNLIEFDPGAKKIRLSTYSPKNNADLSGDAGGAAGAKYGNAGTVRTDYDSKFERDFDFGKRFSPTPSLAKTSSVVFQQGVNGYAGSVDTKIEQNAPTSAYSANGTIAVDGETTAGNVSQGLFRFDNVFGSGAGQVPADRDIQRATLRVYVDASVSNSQGSGLLLHRMLSSWDGNATWNALNGGIAADALDAAYVEEDSAGANNGGENVKQGTWINLDVTDSLRAMRQGAANHGWALLPWSEGSNAVIINSSEAFDVTKRPQLSVDVTTSPVVAQSFHNGVNGYSGAKDTWVDENSPAAAHATDPLIRVDAGTTSDYTTPDAQSLIRFDGLTGNGAGQIPEDDVRVTSAMLTINVTSTDANAEGSGLVVHRMTSGWADAATWNSLGDGVVPGTNASTTPEDTLGEDANVVALKPGKLYIDVTTSLRAWTEEGEANLGWAILPTTKGTNAVLFDGVDGPLANRPELIVRYQVLAPASWSKSGSGEWDGLSNWLNQEIPNGVGRTAIFGSAIMAPSTVTLNDDRVVGTLRFDSVNSYTIAGSGTLTLGRTSGPARVQVLRGAHKILADVKLAGDAEIDVGSTSSLMLSHSLIGESNNRVTKIGSGLLTLPSIHVTSLQLQQGSVSLRNGVSMIEELEVASGARLTLDGGSFLLDYHQLPPLSDIVDLVRAQSIRADQSNPAFAIGYAEVSDLPGLSQILGVPVDSTSIFIASTLRGDSNLDGLVDFADLLILAQNYGRNEADLGWVMGNSNYDNVIDFTDLLALAQNYGASGTVSFESDWQLARSMTPEPGIVLGVLAFGVSVSRRRR